MIRHVQSFRPVSPEGATEHRQVVERSETPASLASGNENPDGVTEFCRTFGTYILVDHLSRGFASLHRLPVFCRPFGAYGTKTLHMSGHLLLFFSLHFDCFHHAKCGLSFAWMHTPKMLEQ